MSVTMSQPSKPPPRDTSGAARDIDWDDFRDHLATADQHGNRRWLYPKKPAGRWHQRRAWFAVALIAGMFAGPWIRINGNPLLMLNILERRFSILGQIFWPQDTVIFAVAMLVFITSIIIFTTAFGRLWCGWACPQTVMMEMVFRKIEYLIEGDAHEQRALDSAPWRPRKIFKKAFKHAAFLGLSFIVGNTLLAYIIGSDRLLAIQFDDPRHHLAGLSFMTLFTLVFYSIFARFREQACTFICPYGRFQSAMLDENSMVVAYDHKRGEKRAALHRDQTHPQRTAAGLGDCVACRQCVAVCPTGIDIRNGTQMECVNCTACIDACDTIMDKVGRPRGLIRFASLNNIERGELQRFTPRMKLYATILAALIALFLFLVFTRAEAETTLLRAPGTLFQQTVNGKIQNLYTMKVINKSARALPVELKLENFSGIVRLMGAGSFVVPKEDIAQTSVLIELDPEALTGNSTKLRLGVYANGKLLETVTTVFVGPRK
jgi:cytochrome c oxidase accessory protein FixG